MAFDPNHLSGLGIGAPLSWQRGGRFGAPKYALAGQEGREGSALAGLNILLVEDEFLVALEVEATLETLGCAIVGPFSRLAKALDAARSAPLDGAVLDINLNGEMVYPLAEHLAQQGVPFLFITGYSAADLPERFRTFRRLPKPLDGTMLRDALVEIRRKGALSRGH